ncbi:MAG: PRC-barrel domain-containing protein [Rhodoferax sp.]
MLRSTQEMKNYAIGATDGEIGHVTDFFFDDESWVIRYLVVETGSWLLSRKVLISPFSLMDADWMHKRLPVRITREQIKHSPDIDTHKPVSRQHEMAYADYYGYPYYWGGSGLWGDGLYAPLLASRNGIGNAPPEVAIPHGRGAPPSHLNNDPHLRSCQSVIGYHIHASDGDIGHLQELLVDEKTWSIRYMVVDTRHYWIGHTVLVSPDWVKDINWGESNVTLDLMQQSVKDSPRFDSTAELNRQRETEIHQHYGRPNYWDKEQRQEMTDAQD